MKYYAVADDPNELLHYGRLGMKWGQHIFVGTKSLSYKKAEGKLRSKIQNAKATIQKSRTQHAVNRQKRQQEKFAKAVQKTQQRIALTEGFRDMDRLKAYERSDNRAFKQAYKAAKIADKNARAEARNELRYANNERKMEKYTQQAREGKLKYGKLSSDQVNQITNRLAIEANARRLGSAEKTWHQQKKEAFRSGKLEGIKRGTAAAMEEVARAGAIYGIKNIGKRMKLNADAKQQGKEEKLRNRERNKRSRREIRQDVKVEAYETKVESTSRMAKKAQKAQIEAQYNKRLMEAGMYDQTRLQKLLGKESTGEKVLRLETRNDIAKKLATAKAYDSDSGKELSRIEARNDIMKKLETARALDSDQGKELRKLERQRADENFDAEEARFAKRTERQNRENEERADRALLRKGQLAYEYGIGLKSGEDNKGNNNGNKGKGKKNGGDDYSTEEAKQYYIQKVLKGKTIQEEAAEKKAADKQKRLEAANRKEQQRKQEEFEQWRDERHKLDEQRAAEEKRRIDIAARERATESEKAKKNQAIIKQEEQRRRELREDAEAARYAESERIKQNRQAWEDRNQQKRLEAGIERAQARLESSSAASSNNSSSRSSKERDKKYSNAAKEQRKAASNMNNTYSNSSTMVFDQLFPYAAENRRNRHGRGNPLKG